jgi:hypothetical protein
VSSAAQRAENIPIGIEDADLRHSDLRHAPLPACLAQQIRRLEHRWCGKFLPGQDGRQGSRIGTL